MVRSLPAAVGHYVLAQPDLSQFRDSFPEDLTSMHSDLQVLQKICASEPNDRIECALWGECFEYVKLLFDADHELPPNASSIAAARGSLEALKFCFERSPEAKSNPYHLCSQASNIECLKYLHEQGCALNGAADAAAKRGDIESLRFCVAHEKPSPLALNFAAKNGHIECLRLLLRLPGATNMTYTSYAMSMSIQDAARCGQMQSLREMRGVGVTFSILSARAAIDGGHVDCLDYILSQGVTMNFDLMYHASMVGSLSCLQYLHNRQCEWRSSCCAVAAKRGHLECLVYLHEHGCPWDKETVEMAATGDKLPCLLYALQQGLTLITLDLVAVAAKDALECLQYGIENGAPWNTQVRDDILRYGKPRCVDYVQGLPTPPKKL